MNISLTPALERFVKEQVKSGRYLDTSDVVRSAVRLRPSLPRSGPCGV